MQQARRAPIAYKHVPSFAFGKSQSESDRPEAGDAGERAADPNPRLSLDSEAAESFFPSWLTRSASPAANGPGAAPASSFPAWLTGARAAEAAAPASEEAASQAAPKEPWELEVAAYASEVAAAARAAEDEESAAEAAAASPAYAAAEAARAEQVEDPALPPHADVLRHLAQAYNEEDPEQPSDAASAAGFRWTSVMDAAHAAWIGGTRLLRYGEVLPGGVEKVISCLLAVGEGGPTESAGGHGSTSCRRQLALELGMGRGRLALQMFLSGATVIGAELAHERYSLASSALERLAHRCPQHFEISKRTDDAVRIRRRGGPRGSVCEVRQGNFFEAVSEEETRAATLIFCQVCMPPAVWPRMRQLLRCAHVGSRLLLYEDLRDVWGEDDGPCPFRHLGSPNLAASWAPKRGHRFHLYERTGTEEPAQADAGVADSPAEDDGHGTGLSHAGGASASSSAGAAA